MCSYRPSARRPLLGPQARQALAGDQALLGAVGLEGLATPDLEAVAKTDDSHPVAQTERIAQGLGQGDATGGGEAELAHGAQHADLKRGAQGIAERKLANQGLVAVEQGLAAAF